MASYFSYLPNIDLAIRPIRFPWSEQQYKVAKNIFRRFKLSDSVLDTATYFKKYVIDDSDRPDLVSELLYGRSDYDWVIMMCNKFINCPFTDLDSMPELPALEYLVLDAFPNLQKLDRLTIFTTLKVLYLRMLNKIIDIRPLGDIENLGLLDLTGTRFSPSAPSHILLGSEIRTICNETWSKSISLVESH